MSTHRDKEIWVFGDYRNYFQNRVTLQILAKAVDLASVTGGTVCAVVFGHGVSEWVGEYIAHGAEKVYVIDDAALESYAIETYAWLLQRLAGQCRPEIPQQRPRPAPAQLRLPFQLGPVHTMRMAFA